MSAVRKFFLKWMIMWVLQLWVKWFCWSTVAISNSSLFQFFHNVGDIVAPYDKGTTMRYVATDVSMTFELLLGLTTAEAEVRNLPIAYRKCRYKDENDLQYFQVFLFVFMAEEIYWKEIEIIFKGLSSWFVSHRVSHKCGHRKMCLQAIFLCGGTPFAGVQC